MTHYKNFNSAIWKFPLKKRKKEYTTYFCGCVFGGMALLIHHWSTYPHCHSIIQ